MPYRIHRHPEVEWDLFSIVDLIAEYACVEVAERKLKEIEQSIKNLAQTPHIGSIHNDLCPGLRAIPSARKGVITFTIDDELETVYIINITYAGADWINHLSRRLG